MQSRAGLGKPCPKSEECFKIKAESRGRRRLSAAPADLSSHLLQSGPTHRGTATGPCRRLPAPSPALHGTGHRTPRRVPPPRRAIAPAAPPRLSDASDWARRVFPSRRLAHSRSGSGRGLPAGLRPIERNFSSTPPPVSYRTSPPVPMLLPRRSPADRGRRARSLQRAANLHRSTHPPGSARPPAAAAAPGLEAGRGRCDEGGSGSGPGAEVCGG